MARTLGNYELVGKLGEGGMGVVYLAEHRHLRRRAAVKVLSSGLFAEPMILERFFAEARATSSIQHPGIVEVLDCDVDATGTAFIVMEYLTGQSLAAALLRTARFSLEEAVWVIERVAEAMSAAHAKDIVHRDLKPDNVYVLSSPPGAIKVLDFGIAKLLEGNADRGNLTRTGLLLGTPRYMSPEQCRGAGRVDHRTDLYALGCIFFELLCGHPPFEHEGIGDLISAHIGQPPPSPRALLPSLPAEVDALVLALLAKQPEARPQSMDELLQRLRALAVPAPSRWVALAVEPRPEPVKAAATVPLAAAATSAAAASAGGTVGLPLATPPGPVPRSARDATTARTREEGGAAEGSRKTRLILAAGAVGLLTLGGGLLLAPRLRPDAPSPAPVTGPAPPSSAVAPPPVVAQAPAPLPSTVQIDVAEPPAGLVLHLDGRPVTLPVQVPRGSTSHVLRLEAPGHEPEELTLDGSRDRTLVLSAVKAATPASGTSATAKPEAGPTPSSRRSRASRAAARAFTDL